MNNFVTGVTVDRYLWALKEDVRVTLVASDPNLMEASYLIERLRPVAGPWPGELRALVISFHDNGMVLINGQYIDLEEDLMSWCGLVDAVTDNPECHVGFSVVVPADPENYGPEETPDSAEFPEAYRWEAGE